MPGAYLTSDTLSGLHHADGLRPLDHPWALAAAWSELRPRLLVFIEGSWYPALAKAARSAGVPVVCVGTRFHERTVLKHRMLGWPDGVFARDVRSAHSFRDHVKVHGVSGSLKGFSSAGNPLVFQGEFWVGACTYADEEDALHRAWTQSPRKTLVLAPRQLARVPDLQRRFPGALLRTALNGVVPAGSVVVLDTLGELKDVLVGARVALIGGTFDQAVNGHSPMEARCAGVPFVHGPFIANNAPDFEGGRLLQTLSELSTALEGPPPPPPLPTDGLGTVVASLEAVARPSAAVAPRPWARPLVPAHRLKVWRRSFRRVRPRVIAVGSRNARGAGKTSLTAFVARGLLARGLSVGVVTRGVGAWCRGDSEANGADSSFLGDEGALLALGGLRVVAGPWEWGIEQLAGLDRIVLEDGLQAGFGSVAVESVDARFPSARGAFPMGDDRGLCRPSDVVVQLNGMPSGDPSILTGVFSSGEWSLPVAGPAVAFTGIARPADFFETVPLVQEVRSFPNHHRYGPADQRDLLRWADGRTLLTTTRDAVRFPRRFPVVHRGVELRVERFPWGVLL